MYALPARACEHTCDPAVVGKVGGRGVQRPGNMSQETTVSVPAIEDVLSEVVVTLALVARTYLEPPADGTAADLDAAGIAIDTAGAAFDRVSKRLKPEQRTALSALLTDVRMTFVRRRGG
jgi:hypothetical protein